MSIRIGQASLGETGGRGQKPGNQTGRELNFSYWYNGSWLGILRFKDPAMSERAAQACEDGVRNRNIGYDMDGRNTAYAAAEAVDFALGKIKMCIRDRFLLSEIEIFGSVSYSKSGEGTQYDYYKAGNTAHSVPYVPCLHEPGCPHRR